jgi:3-oxoadipate enol-lactonase
MTEGTVDLGDHALWYERRGSGEPLLLLGGMSAHRAHWREPFVAALASGFELVLVDHRGTGRSSAPKAELTLGDLAQDALSVLDALEVDRSHVFGFSMGGAVALELALGAPARVGRVVLGAPAVASAEAALDASALAEMDAAAASGDFDRALRTAWEVNVAPRAASDEAAFAEFAAAATSARISLRMIRAQRAAIAAQCLAARLGDVRAATTVLHGSEDRVVPVERGRAVAAALDAPLEVLDGRGHLFHWEDPAGAAARIGAFLGAGRVA